MSKLDIVFENSNMLVVNKPPGLVVNRSETTRDITLQDLIAQYLKLKSGDLGIGERAGIVHRLDRETSGLVVVAKAQKAFENLQEQFKLRKVEKEYVALVHGTLDDDRVEVKNKIVRVGKFGRFGIAKGRQEGREAESIIVKSSIYKLKPVVFYNILEKGIFNRVRSRYLEKNGMLYTLVSVFPKTGRTHQIRVHLKYTGHPIVSDSIYAPSKLKSFDLLWCPRLFLHAKKISFRDPASGKLLLFNADLPKDLKSAMLFLALNA